MQFIDQKEAQHLLRKIPYEQWLTIGRMMIPKGVHHARISSLGELEWSMRPTAKTLVVMRFENLEHWLRASVGDSYLAGQVEETMKKDIPFVEQSQEIYDLVSVRVKSLQSIAGEEVDYV